MLFLTFVYRLRRRTNVKQTLNPTMGEDNQCVSQQTQNICITFVQRRPNVFDVGPTMYKCYTKVLCVLG